MSTKKDEALTKEITPVVAQAHAIVITTPVQMVEATELLSTVNKKLDMVEAEEDRVLLPLKEAMKAEQSRWKPIKTMLKEAIDTLRSNMSTYQTAELKREREEKEKIAARVAKGTLKMETGVRKLDEVEAPASTINTTVGTAGFRTIQKLVIVDEQAIPRKYLMVDEVKLKAALKGGVTVPGAVLEDVQSVVNRR